VRPLRKRKGELISALKPLTPTSIINTATGEYVSPSVLQEKLALLVTAVRDETIRLYSQSKTVLDEELVDYTGTPQPAEYARQKGYLTSFNESLPKPVKAKSRLEKLTQYKLISETASYILNPNPDKKEHSFSHAINLGAVDKQMASLSLDDTELNLLWKCWDEEYYLTFDIPSYVLDRDIVRFTLPTIKLDKKIKQYVFVFALVEMGKPRKGKAHTIGIDLGKIKPYSMAVVNHAGNRVASYDASPRLTQLSRKRERLIAEVRNLDARIENRAKRGLSSQVHETEYYRTRDKATRLTKTIAQQTGAEITNKLAKHNSNLIKIENLKWISGTQTSKIGSSRWSHSLQQEAITHSTTRIGYTTKRVSAKDTSQSCHSCGNKIKHQKNRTVWCGECKSRLDRDFNAAMNIAKQPIFPVSKKLNGNTTGNSGVTPILESGEAFSGLLARPTG
jgi:hypothetical protein